MKVKCIRIVDSSGQTQERSAWLTIGKVYDVLAIECDIYGRWLLRLIGDGLNGVALFEKDQFEVVSSKVLPTWTVSWNDKGGFKLMPEAWSQPGFWERYYDREPEALSIFEQEMQRISDDRLS